MLRSVPCVPPCISSPLPPVDHAQAGFCSLSSGDRAQAGFCSPLPQRAVPRQGSVLSPQETVPRQGSISWLPWRRKLDVLYLTILMWKLQIESMLSLHSGLHCLVTMTSHWPMMEALLKKQKKETNTQHVCSVWNSWLYQLVNKCVIVVCVWRIYKRLNSSECVYV